MLLVEYEASAADLAFVSAWELGTAVGLLHSVLLATSQQTST